MNLTNTLKKHKQDCDESHPKRRESMTSGGIQAEWSFGPNEVTFELNLDAHSGEWHELNLETNPTCERILDCNKLQERLTGIEGHIFEVIARDIRSDTEYFYFGHAKILSPSARRKGSFFFLRIGKSEEEVKKESGHTDEQ